MKIYPMLLPLNLNTHSIQRHKHSYKRICQKGKGVKKKRIRPFLKISKLSTIYLLGKTLLSPGNHKRNKWK